MYNRFPNSAAAKPEDSAGGGSSSISGSTSATATINSNNSNNLLPHNTVAPHLSATECALGKIPLLVHFPSEGESGDNSSKGAALQCSSMRQEKKRKLAELASSSSQTNLASMSNSDEGDDVDDNDDDDDDDNDDKRSDREGLVAIISSDSLEVSANSINNNTGDNVMAPALSAKDLIRLRNKEHARVTRKRRKQRIDIMKNNLLQLAAENEMLTRKYEDRETATMLLSILDPMVGSSNAALGGKVTLKSSDEIIGEIMDAAKLAAQKQVELNSLKLKEINKGFVENKSKTSSSSSSSSNNNNNNNSSSSGGGGSQVEEEGGSGLNAGNSSSSLVESILNNSDDQDDQSIDASIGNSGDVSIRKQRNRIHSMNTRERRKRFYATLASTIEELKHKNLKLQEAINNNINNSNNSNNSDISNDNTSKITEEEQPQ